MIARDTSDAGTGLPPMAEVDQDSTLLVLAWHAQVGVVAVPDEDAPVPVRYLTLRGLTRSTPGDDSKVEWAQFTVAVPVDQAMDVAAALASGGMFQVSGEPGDDRG